MVYQVAEALGRTAESVRDGMTATELAEWAYYLNGPFSRKGRETLMNGWIVHTIRSIMADKRHKPEFHKSVFPFDKIYKQFFAEGKKLLAKSKGTAQPPRRGKPTSIGEVAHMTQVIHRNYEKALADYKAGRRTNRWGLYIHEKMKA